VRAIRILSIKRGRRREVSDERRSHRNGNGSEGLFRKRIALLVQLALSTHALW